MEESLTSSESRIGKVRWTICAMLFVATSINYIDRQVIGLLKPTLSANLGITEQSYSYIIACFQFAYASGLLLAGRLVDRIGSRKAYPIIMATWSLSAMAHSIVHSAWGFAIARFFLGLGESGNFPAAIKTVSEWFPQRERSLATGIFNSGANIGAMVAPAVVPWIALRYGWRPAFLVTGVIVLPWIAWWWYYYRKPNDHPTLTGAELRYIYSDAANQMSARVPWLRLLGHRQTWAFATAKFLTDPIWWFYLFWLPGYLDQRFHLGLGHLGLPIVIVYNMSTIGSIGGGWLPSLFQRFGMKVTSARLAAMAFCACCALPMLFITHVQSMWVAVALLSLATAGHQGWSANVFTTASDMFPSHTVGSVTGIGGMAGSVGGILLSLAVGRILAVTHSYQSLFILAATVYLFALLMVQLLAPNLRRVDSEITA